jgi:hypothetical protein
VSEPDDAVHMAPMTTATLTAPAVDSRPIADIINEALQGQSTQSPLDALDRCDRCGAAAQSVFTYSAADVMLCGHHMRMHLPALLEQRPKEFWIDPSFLFKIKGVKVPRSDNKRTGDGLTDA